MRISLLFLFALGLTACDLYANPGYLPTGYTYHNDLYKAAPGPAAPAIGYSYSAAKNREVLEGWDAAAADLLNQLEQKGLQAQPVYVETIKDNNAFTSTYDHIMREELRKHGYVLEQDITAPVHIRYDAYLPVKDKSMAGQPAETGDETEDFILVLTLNPGTANEMQVSGVYRLPAYGYNRNTTGAPVADVVFGGGR